MRIGDFRYQFNEKLEKEEIGQVRRIQLLLVNFG